MSRFVIPNGTVIPARGHYLSANNTATTGYSLGSIATPNATFTTNMPENRGVALFRTATAANYGFEKRLDAVASGAQNQLVAPAEPTELYREGYGSYYFSGLTTGQHSIMRWQNSGVTADTDSNGVETRTISSPTSSLPSGASRGMPGPENLASPVQINASLGAALFDPAAVADAAPNIAYDFTPATIGSTTFAFGSVILRRRIINNTGGPIMSLRFRIADLFVEATRRSGSSPTFGR